MSDQDEVLGMVDGSKTLFLFWCYGCECAHHLETKPGAWTWDGSMTLPTAKPSLLLRAIPPTQQRCHFFIRGGQLQFLSDCGHALAGKTAPMTPWKDAGAPAGTSPGA